MNTKNLTKIIYYTLTILIIAALLASGIAPMIYDFFKGGNTIPFKEHGIMFKVTFYFCYYVTVFIVYLANQVFLSVYKDTPFKKEIEQKIKLISLLFIILSLVVTIKTIFIPTLLSLAVIIITFLASLSFYVISEVIKSAINYKQIADYTI